MPRTTIVVRASWWRDELTVYRAAQTVFEPGGLGKPLTYAIAI